jgi:hypothetical protein
MAKKDSETIATHDSKGNLTGSLATAGKNNVPTPSALPRVATSSNHDDPCAKPRVASITRWETLYDSKEDATRGMSPFDKMLFDLPPQNQKQSRITISVSKEPVADFLRCVIVPAEGKKTTKYFWGETAYSDVRRYAHDHEFGWISI